MDRGGNKYGWVPTVSLWQLFCVLLLDQDESSAVSSLTRIYLSFSILHWKMGIHKIKVTLIRTIQKLHNGFQLKTNYSSSTWLLHSH